VDTKLVVDKGIAFSGSTSYLNIDMSAAPTKKCEIYWNKDNITTSGANSNLAITGKFNLKGAQKTTWTTATDALVGGTTLSVHVTDATGWREGDKLVFATTQAYDGTVISTTAVSWAANVLTVTNSGTNASLEVGDHVIFAGLTATNSPTTMLNVDMVVSSITSTTEFKCSFTTDPGVITDQVGTATKMPRTDAVTIAVGGITFDAGTAGPATITWSDGKGAGGSVAHNHADNCLVANFTRNLILGPAVIDGVAPVILTTGANANNGVINDVEFSNSSPTSTFGTDGVVVVSGTNSAIAGINRCAFYNFRRKAISWSGALNGIPRSDNVYYTEKTFTFVNAMVTTKGPLGNETNMAVLRCETGPQFLAPGITLFDPMISGLWGGAGSGAGQLDINNPGAPMIASYGDAVVDGGGVWSCRYAAAATQTAGGKVTFRGTYIGNGFPGSDYSGAGNGWIFSAGGPTDIVFDSCPEDLTGTTARIVSASSGNTSEAAFYNRDADPLNQDIYRPKASITSPTFVRDAAEMSNANASMRIDTLGTFQISREFSVLVKGGEAATIFVKCKKNAAYGSSTRPTAQLTGLGTAFAAVTCPDNTDWNVLDLSYAAIDAPTSDGILTLTLTAQSATSTGSAYFSGIPITPFVTRVRHYGWVVNETSSTQVADPAIDPGISQATAAAYADIAITWGATSSLSTGADQTFKKLVHYTAATMISNVASALPITWAGACNAPAIFAQGAIDISADTLNGPGSLDMGAYQLTATTPFSYTYTGGTWSQATTVPTFAGGTLTLPTAITTSPGFTMSSGAIVFGATSALWDLSTCTIDSGVTLSNTSGAGITVAMPAGYPTTTIGSGATEIIVTAPVVERGLEFTGLLAGSQVKVFTTTTDTERFSDNNSSTTETWDDATNGSITVDYVVQKAGYLPIRVTGVVVTGAVGTGIQTVQISQVPARWYQASAGLTINTNAFANAGTKLFGLTVASTLQNFASYMLEQWIALGDTGEAYANKEFPIEANGPNSFTFRLGWEWDLTTYANSISNLSRDGQRYMSAAGAVTASWAAILTSGALAGSQVRYQQSDAGTTVNAENTGEMDQLVQIYGDATHGNFDKTGYLVLKVQREGYDQAEANVVTLYGTLEDQLYVVGLTPAANGIATGDPALTITISQGTYTEDGKTFSVRIVDNVTPSSGTDILRELRYNFAAGGAYQGEDAFNWHDLVQKNGSSFKTVRGTVYGTAATKGVLVYKNDGVTLHPDFNLFTADDGTTVTPASTVTLAWASAVAGTMILIYNDSQAGVLVEGGLGGVLASTGYSRTYTLPHADLSVGDTLRLRYASKTEDAGEITGVLSADGLTFLETQATDAAYAAWGLNGAAMTEFTADRTNIDIDIAGGGPGVTFNSQKKRIGAWWKYILTTPAGLDAFYGAFTFAGPGSIRQNVSSVDVKLQETSGAAIVFTDNNVRYYRSDNSCPYDTTPGFGSMFIDYDGQPYTVATGSGVTPTDKTEIATAVRSELATELAATLRAEKFARNKQVLNPATGERVVYDNDGTTVLGQGNAYMDVAGTQPYNGTGPVHRTERLA
jgi:hypothetical protein